MIPIESLWYIIGAVSVPVFITIYLKALKRNRADKAQVSMRRRRFERLMKLRASSKSVKQTKSPAPNSREATEIDRVDSECDTVPEKNSAGEHWLSRVKMPVKREESGHWLETIKPKRSRHWLENLRK